METNHSVIMPNLYNDYKARNILSLADRVEVIREYDRQPTKPSLQKLASKFECSSKQIKNILMNREAILQTYNGGAVRSQKPVSDSVQKRQEKIIFLGKVMYEYIQRVLYYNHSINDHKFRQKALQIKECIAIENFQPTQTWMNDFKSTYAIPLFDLASLRNNVVLTETKRPYLNAIDLIQHVSRMEQESQIDGNRTSEKHSNTSFSLTDNISSPEQKVIVEIDDEEDEEFQKLNVYALPPPPQQTSFSTATPKITTKRRASSPFPDIESADEALKHLKALEEYAMLQDNFRAIGLITQLEQIFQKKCSI